jgi:hypothetical protein
MLIALIVFASLNSCQQLLDDARDNPNAVTEIDDAAVFAKSLRALFLGTTDESVYRFAGQYAHYFVAGSDVRKPDLYGDGFDTYYNDMYAEVYGEVIKHIEEVLVITSTGDTENEVRHAIADVISVLGFSKLTDAFGDIPYTEGGKGKTDEILTPKYDSQEYIYEDLINRLTNSIEILSTADADYAYLESDFLFHNDMDRWLRFANSVRFRLAMRLRNIKPEFSKSIVDDCLAAPLMDTYAHDAAMIETEGAGNHWYLLKTTFPQIKVSEMFVNQLQVTDDPRMQVFVSEDANGGYSGQLNGLNDIEFGKSDFSNKSNMGDAISSKDSRLYLMCAAEVWFLKAEAFLVYYSDAVKANECYQKGIETSLRQWNVGEVAINTFLGTPTSTLSGTKIEMEEQIGIQMWLALTPNYFESWSHIRRTGFPVIEKRTAPELEPGVTGGIMPARFKYSSFELSANGANVKDAIERQGPNKIDTPVWWDQN